MAGKVAARRAELRKKLIDAAEARIAEGGLSSVKARDLAAEAGCALGAIYNIFSDLNDLILEVNGRTFLKLGQAVAHSVVDSREGPRQRLVAMSYAYLDFASENPHSWRALFDIRMSADGPVPQWYLESLGNLFAHIRRPLSELFPDLDAAELDLLTRTLFSSVHGIVLLGVENRISGVPGDQIRRMIAQLLLRIGALVEI